jgi:16S rRNA G966 N2-methylase RsmD
LPALPQPLPSHCSGRRARGKLYYGDDLEVLRNEIADESVDLIYLDPPFNSNAGYALERHPDGGGV